MTAVEDIYAEIARIKREMAKRESAVAGAMALTYQHIVDELLYEIDRLKELIEREPWRADQAFTARNFTRLFDALEDAQAQFDAFTSNSETLLNDAIRDAMRTGWDGSRAILNQFTGDLGFKMSINNAALQSLVSGFETGPIRGVMQSYGDNALQVVRDELARGLSQGLGSDEIKRKIAKLINGGEMTARIDALVRTVTMRALREGQLASYRDLGAGIVPMWRWSCSKSARTCMACLAMDGRTFPINMPFSRAHVSCRCVAIPVVDSAYFDPPKIESGAEWFARQPEDIQRSMLPTRGAFEAYRDDRISLDDMVGERSDPVWGTSVYAKSGKQMLAGVSK